MYGPTETTVWSTVQRVGSGTGPPPVGRPIANTRVYIVDPEGSPVPIGVAGELLIAGSGLARGYRNHDALTRERFVTSTALPGERLYRTGDLARWHNGTLEYLGRTDQQVKVRGFRIAPEEIEAALGTHPGVSAAAVRCYSDKEGEQSLVAYVAQRGLRAPEPSELRQHLSQILPTYMLPSRIVTLTSLPTTPNGKLDRKRLPKVDASSPLLDIQTPQGDHEQRLAEIWRELLGVDQVGRNEDFFDLGGHSLLAAKLLRRIDACFGVRLPMASVLHALTVTQMAALISARGSRPTQPVQLRPAASAACLLWINGGPAFRHLHKIMEQADWPLVSVPIEPEDLLGQGEGPSVGEIAARLAQRIRSVQPTGPYYIGGWCVDGIIAFEAAAQLTSDGADIGSVVLLHSPNPVHYHRMGASSVRLSKLKYHWKKIGRLRGPARWSYAAARLRGAAEPVTPWLPTSVLQNAALKYEPRSYRGPVLLLQPIERPSILDYRQGWEEVVTGTLEFSVCPGDHNTMLEPPNVEILAGRIRAHLGSTVVSAASLPKAARR
jgi:thioesterase domain-containing protein/acyl carrier protein